MTALVGGGLTAAVPAHAALVDLDCAGLATAHYSPGLTNTVQTVAITGSAIYYPCVSSDLTLVSGTSTVSAVGVASCTSGGFAGTAVFHWNNGGTTTANYTATINAREDGEAVTTATGEVVSGEFVGDTYTSVNVLTTLQVLACETSGLTSVTGPRDILLTDLG